MRWLSNAQDHRKAGYRPVLSSNDPDGRYYREWLRDKVVGRPKATETYTVEKLEAMGLIGLYQAEKRVNPMTLVNIGRAFFNTKP
jgi:hypothetical protein